MSELSRLFDVEKVRTSPYKPSTNHVERFRRTMNSMLAKTVAEYQKKNWDVHLSFAMAAYQAIRHDATGYSPNFLVLGREARAPPVEAQVLPDIEYGSPEDEPDERYDKCRDGLRRSQRQSETKRQTKLTILRFWLEAEAL